MAKSDCSILRIINMSFHSFDVKVTWQDGYTIGTPNETHDRLYEFISQEKKNVLH